MKSINILINYFRENFKLFTYQKKFATIGDGLEVFGKPVIHGEGNIKAGMNLALRSLVLPIEIYAGKGATISIGNNVDINQGVTIGALKQINIGDFSTIGDQSIIYDTDWHGLDGNESKISPVKIGEHVWICARAIILKGVDIGDYSVIGAGSVVTGKVEPYTIVAGSPARKIGSTMTGYTYVPHHKLERPKSGF